MSNIPPPSGLIDFIKNNHLEYYGKICELREEIEEWLAYIPNTFPHYTRHTIKHSDIIVSQMSKLLFRDTEPLKPIVNLSGIEAYILVVAAYLHDAGMVTSDKEKGEILTSEAWKKWTSGDGGGATRWNAIQELRSGTSIADAATRNFLADVQTRFLIAEFIRGQHHFRAATVIEVHSDKLGRIDFGDHMLQKAIAQVCVGHGLRLHELDDNERFPDLCDIREEKVNLRFLAILLRLGDLLDMSVDRACPLLLSAGSPLPPDSFPHWEQYKAITVRATSPEAIKVSAECQSQDAHRVLQDWCQWIVDEVNHAKLTIPKSQRHSDWQVPDATIEADSPTIKIKRAAGAAYVPSKWVLQFDQQAIFERLSANLYSSPLEFIRGLIQNALDAIRCRMYSDLAQEGKDTPEYPTQVPEDFRNRYSVKLTISNKEIVNQMSGEKETKQILVIEDNGIGMDADIIEKYFLQVGRSYYTSEEFRRNYQFHPTSRFGIGFLSVFSASDNVKVDTYKPTSHIKNTEPISITLTGFRNYLLRERSERKNAGTRIEIVLRDEVKSGRLTEMVSNWCKRVEFPIYVDDFGEETLIIAERPDMFTYEQPLVTNPNAKFVMRSFPVKGSGIEGELYVLAYVEENGESWAARLWSKYTYANSHPMAAEPKLVSSLYCFHGITVDEAVGFRGEQLNARIDFRSSKFLPILDRSKIKFFGEVKETPDELKLRWAEILREHLKTTPLAKTENAWKYKQKLIDEFLIKDFWSSVPETIKVYHKNAYKLLSLDEFLIFNDFRVVMELGDEPYMRNKTHEHAEKYIFELNSEIPAINYLDLLHISNTHLQEIFNKYTFVKNVIWLPNGYAAYEWSRKEKSPIKFKVDYKTVILTNLNNPDLIILKTHQIEKFHSYEYLINIHHPLIEWVVCIRNACLQKTANLQEWQFENLLRKIIEFHDYSPNEEMLENLKRYLSEWKNLPDLPADLYPPEIELNPEMFRRR